MNENESENENENENEKEKLKKKVVKDANIKELKKILTLKNQKGEKVLIGWIKISLKKF